MHKTKKRVVLMMESVLKTTDSTNSANYLLDKVVVCLCMVFS